MSNSTRSTSSYDERYVVPLEASRRGAHRARVSPVMAVLPVVAVAGIVVGAIALVYLFFGGLGSSDSASQATTSAGPTTTPTASSTPGAQQSGATTPAAAGTVDKTITVAVYNGSRVSGLARKVGDKLVAEGWTLGPVQTWTGAAVTVTTVYYATEDQRASALAIVRTVGHGTVKLSATKAGAGMALVIGPDYAGVSGAGMSAPMPPRTHSSASSSTRSATSVASASSTKPSSTTTAPTTTAASSSTPSPTN